MIQIEHLCKSFDAHEIFNDLSFDISDREFVVFTGPSGCGKTTLLNMIGGIEAVSSGRIIVDGIEITKTKNLQLFFRNMLDFFFKRLL